ASPVAWPDRDSRWRRARSRTRTVRPRAPSREAPAVAAPRMTITVGRAAFPMTMLGQVWLELIEKPAATFPHAQRGQAIALRAAVIQQRLSKPIRHELSQRRVHCQAVTDEAEDVPGP